MAIPLIILGAIGLYGAVKAVGAVTDNVKAGEINEKAQGLVEEARKNVDKQRQETTSMIEDYGARKLRAFNGAIADFIHCFGKLKNVETLSSPELEKLQIGDTSNLSLSSLKNDYEALQSAGLGLGAGLGGGAALAFGAYTGTMAFASAGTGAAISSLSGVAATNATLAWLGGGTLAAGGGGMAAGAMVLGGIVAAPALAIFGHIVGNHAEAAVADAESNLEKAKTVEKDAKLIQEQLKAIYSVTALANGVFSKTTMRLRKSVHALEVVIKENGVDYSTYSPENRETVFRAVKLAQLIKAMIDTPILDKDGKLVLSTGKRVRDLEDAAKAIPLVA